MPRQSQYSTSPADPPDPRRWRRTNVRWTEHELTRATANARRAGYAELAAYLRARALEHPASPQQPDPYPLLRATRFLELQGFRHDLQDVLQRLPRHSTREAASGAIEDDDIALLRALLDRILTWHRTLATELDAESRGIERLETTFTTLQDLLQRQFGATLTQQLTMLSTLLSTQQRMEQYLLDHTRLSSLP